MPESPGRPRHDGRLRVVVFRSPRRAQCDCALLHERQEHEANRDQRNVDNANNLVPCPGEDGQDAGADAGTGRQALIQHQDERESGGQDGCGKEGDAGYCVSPFLRSSLQPARGAKR